MTFPFGTVNNNIYATSLSLTIADVKILTPEITRFLIHRRDATAFQLLNLMGISLSFNNFLLSFFVNVETFGVRFYILCHSMSLLNEKTPVLVPVLDVLNFLVFVDNRPCGLYKFASSINLLPCSILI